MTVRITVMMTRAMVVPKRLAVTAGEAIRSNLRPVLINVSKAACSLSLICAALMGLAPATVLALPCGNDGVPEAVADRASEVAKWLVKTMPTDRLTGEVARRAMIDAPSGLPIPENDALKPDPWLDELYALIADDEIEQATDLLFERLDDLLLDGRLEECDHVLRRLEVRRLDSNLMIGVLSVTSGAVDELPYRAELLVKIRAALTEIMPGRVDRLLRGYV